MNIFIQARMSSSRYPGKVLSPLFGQPLIKHLLINVEKISQVNKVVVLTSTQNSDDPLVSYLQSLGVDYFRGELDNVFKRFRDAIDAYPCEYIVRLCADSPLISGKLIEKALSFVSANIDLVTNIYSRSFPKGQSVEVIRTDCFKNIKMDLLSDEEKEHVTPYFYENSEKFRILSFDTQDNENHINMCVDTIEDLKDIAMNRPSYNFRPEKVSEVLL